MEAEPQNAEVHREMSLIEAAGGHSIKRKPVYGTGGTGRNSQQLNPLLHDFPKPVLAAPRCGSGGSLFRTGEESGDESF